MYGQLSLVSYKRNYTVSDYLITFAVIGFLTRNMWLYWLASLTGSRWLYWLALLVSVKLSDDCEWTSGKE